MGDSEPVGPDEGVGLQQRPQVTCSLVSQTRLETCGFITSSTQTQTPTVSDQDGLDNNY